MRHFGIVALLAGLALVGCVPVQNFGQPANVAEDGARPTAEQGMVGFPINVGSRGGWTRVVFHDEEELRTGYGLGLAWEAIWITQGRLEGGLLAFETDDGDSGGMLEASVGGGFALLTLGVGGAVPLWEDGDLEMDPALLAYAGLYAPPIPISLGSLDGCVNIAGRYTWYSGEAEIDGADVDLDGWSVAVTVHLWY